MIQINKYNHICKTKNIGCLMLSSLTIASIPLSWNGLLIYQLI